LEEVQFHLLHLTSTCSGQKARQFSLDDEDGIDDVYIIVIVVKFDWTTISREK
jgi:hypothetical protein